MRGKLLKTGISMVLAAAMMVTSIPASLVSAKEIRCGNAGARCD